MRLMSFSYTTPQMRDRTKTVTRRVGWEHLESGTLLRAVEKSMGLGKGGKACFIGTIRVLDVRRERLDALVQLGDYGANEMALEGFPGRDPGEFLTWLIKRSPSLTHESLITRIHFEHLAALPAQWPFPLANPRGGR